MEPVAGKPVVRKRWYTRLMDLYRYSPVPLPGAAPVIRSLFVRRATRQVRHVAGIAVDSDAIEAWYAEHPVFFGFALFRSGSTFLADFLNQALPRDIVQHEANVNDYYYYAVALRDQEAARRYIEAYRLKEIYLRMRSYDVRAYGEINPFLRRHCAAIRAALPRARIFHLVRDGRRTVRSLLSREIFSRRDPMGPLIEPPPDDPYHGAWGAMSRFERLCWLWQADNRFMRENTDLSVRFERLVAEYEEFRRLLAFLELAIEESAWRAGVARVTNPTPRYRAPPPREWPPAWNAAFDRICGAEMAACGYGD